LDIVLFGIIEFLSKKVFELIERDVLFFFISPLSNDLFTIGIILLLVDELFNEVLLVWTKFFFSNFILSFKIKLF
jgi:hypothetical protein